MGDYYKEETCQRGKVGDIVKINRTPYYKKDAERRAEKGRILHISQRGWALLSCLDDAGRELYRETFWFEGGHA